jgi:hypothetical protein
LFITVDDKGGELFLPSARGKPKAALVRFGIRKNHIFAEES